MSTVSESKESENFEQQQGNEALWQQVFSVGAPDLQKMQKTNKFIPSSPRCKLCNAPFAGIGGWIMRRKGKAQNSRNPNFCNACDGFIEAHPGGAEVTMALLFIDVRGSTDYATKSSPLAVSQRINLFLDTATKIITQHDGFINAFYGDCVVATWPPGFCGEDYAEKCFTTAQKLANYSIKDQEGKTIPVGIGAHAGKMYISTVSAAKGLFRDVSVFGENVNLTARLASQAEASEALISEELLKLSGNKTDELQVKSVNLKGFEKPVMTYSLR